MLIASRNRLARLQYGPNGFRVLAPGDHVLCAVTGAPIGLDDQRECGAQTKPVSPLRTHAPRASSSAACTDSAALA